MDYFSACESIPPKHRFAVGQQVRIVGPSLYGHTDRTGEDTTITLAASVEKFCVLMLEGKDGCIYPASSLAPIAEVPAPRFKRGDKVQSTVNRNLYEIANIEQWTGARWIYRLKNTTGPHAEEYLSPAPAEPVYLPTRYIFIDRDKDHNGYCDSGYATEENTGDHTHVLHDMPADESGVQVDFIRLTDAGYEVGRDGEDKFAWRCPASDKWIASDTAIDAWRAAGRHYLESKGGK